MTTRRDTFRIAAALTAAMAFPATAAAPAPGLRRPPRLRQGDTVGLIEPAGFSNDSYDVELVADTVRALGLVPKIAPNVAKRDGYLAGSDRERAADLQAMYADDSVRAVFAIRGGWGCARILPHLDFAAIRARPKLLTGFSDITALHLAFAARCGFTTIHGPNAASAWGELSVRAFREIAFDGGTPTLVNPPGKENRLVQREGRIRTFTGGKAQGRLLGGNLTVLSALVGTPYVPDFTGAILFLEDVDEAEYRIDRMLTQLRLAGILGKLAGVVFGQCTDCRARSGATLGGYTLSQVLEQHLKPLGVPAFQGALFGHIADQFSLPVGVRAEIDADTGAIRLLEPAVS
ncbi:MAG: LD-carboxypeptidase [Alphaproteobacteria bacterium]|nr:LD-carboxypeptidase [Alphaproteobacteria bacterium]